MLPLLDGSSFTFPFGCGENFNFRLRGSMSGFELIDFLEIRFVVLADDGEDICFFAAEFVALRFWRFCAPSSVVTGVNKFTFTTEKADRRGVVGSIGLKGLLLGLKHSVLCGSDPVSGRTEGTRTIALDEKQLLGVVVNIGLK